MSNLQRRRCDDDSGSALVMALMFLLVFSVLVGMVLQFGYTSLQAGNSTRDEATRTYAADGAAGGAVNALRRDTSMGVDFGSTPIPSSTCFTLPAGSLDNSTALTATCTPKSGSGAAPPGSLSSQPGHALLTTTSNTAEGIDLTAAADVPHKGDVRSSRALKVPAGARLTSTTYVSGQTCAIGGTVTPTAACGVTAPAPVLYPLPRKAGTTVMDYPTVVTTLPTCATGVVPFAPGTYSSRSALQTLINTCSGAVFWFQPGIYYFDFRDAGSHQWTLSTTGGSVVVGGAPSGWTATSSLATVTARFPTAASPTTTNACDTTAQGVEFVFGNDSGMDVQSGRVQMCAYGTSTAEQHIAVRGNIDPSPLSGTGIATTPRATYPLGTMWKDFAPCVSSATLSCGAAVDGRLATVKIPNTGSGTQSVELNSFNFAAVVPPEASTVTITATSSQRVEGSGTMDVVFVPGDGSATTTVTSKTCPRTAKCVEAAITASTAPAFTVPYSALSGAVIRYAVTNTDTAPIEVWLDGLSLSVAFDAPMRTTSSPGPYVTGSSNAVLKASGAWPATQLAIRGTVYARDGVVDLALTGVPHEVVDRGVIARHARLAMSPAGAYAGPLISIPRIDQDPRYVFVVVRDSSANVLLRAEVALANSTGAINGDIPRIERWSQQ